MNALDILRFRQRLNLTQRRLAKLLNVREQTIRNWENPLKGIPNIVEVALRVVEAEHPKPRYWLLGLNGAVRVVDRYETEGALVELVYEDTERAVSLWREIDPEVLRTAREARKLKEILDSGEDIPNAPFKT